MKTAAAAQGKWLGILKQLGIEESFLRNVHGPCPLCGGQDRFRFDDKEGNGTFYCNACGAGDGMKLAILWTGGEFKDVAKRIDDMVGNIKAQGSVKPKSDPSHRINRIWSQSINLGDDDPVTRYLKSRGLPKCQALRLHEALAYYENGKKQGVYPAMVSPVIGSEGELITLHITYLSQDGSKAKVSSVKKILPPMGETSGACVRLTRVYERIGVAEGIETALAAMKIYRIPVWASCNANMMEKFLPPAGVKFVTVFSDNDANYRGQAAAYTLANSLTVKHGITAAVEIPDQVGDYADLL